MPISHVFDTYAKTAKGTIMHFGVVLDFNDWMGLIHRHFHDQLKLKEVFQIIHGRHARTFPVWMPLLPMDRIYYRSLEPITCTRLGHLSWRSLSDHVPLSATFQL